jgi:hypothetical protein
LSETPSSPPETASVQVAPEQESSRKKWILGGCLGFGCLIVIFLFVIALFLFGGVALFKAGSAPWKAVNGYLEAVKARDYAQAYIYLSDDLQKEMSLSDFISFIRTHPDEYEGIERAKLKSLNISDNRALIEGVIIYSSSKETTFEASLIKEDNVWRISGITIR